MQRLRILGLGFLAVFMMSAVASSSALALENPEILPNPTASTPLKFSGENKTTSLLESKTNKEKIECTLLSVNGSFNSARLGPVTIDFTGCTSKGAKCHTEGDEAGTILVAGEIHLVDFKVGTVLTLGGVILFPELSITCGILKIKVKGNVEGVISGVTSGVKTETATITFKQTGGAQENTKCELPKTFCEGKTFGLEAEFGKGFEPSGEAATTLIKFADKEHAVDF